MKIAFDEIPDLRRLLELVDSMHEFIKVVEPDKHADRVQKHFLLAEHKRVLEDRKKW